MVPKLRVTYNLLSFIEEISLNYLPSHLNGKSQILAKLKLSVLSFSWLPIGNICLSFFFFFYLFIFLNFVLFFYICHIFFIPKQMMIGLATIQFSRWNLKMDMMEQSRTATTRDCVSTRSTEWCDINRFLCFKFCFCHQNFRLRKHEDFNDENHTTTITPGHKPWNKRSEFWFHF